MPIPRIIKFAEIRKGDRIRRMYESGDCTYTIEGVATILSDGDWSTDNLQLLARDYYSHTLELIDRPKSPLPMTPASFIYATRLAGMATSIPVTMYLNFSGKWVSIPYGDEYNPEQVQEWEHATLTEDY